MVRRTSILFLCTGNSCRSQMAEGLARSLRGDRLDVASAGTAPQQLNPLAVAAMAEIGIDISHQNAKSVAELRDPTFDYVITVCADAHEACPLWAGRGVVVHHGFDDPPRLAAGAATPAEALPHYRRVRDEIRAFVLSLPDSLSRRHEPGADR